jgi:hypothetical protein
MSSAAVIIRCLDPARAAEALRAAVGMTLRFDRVLVVPGATRCDERGARSLAVLRSLGHTVDAGLEDALAADVVEVWT